MRIDYESRNLQKLRNYTFMKKVENWRIYKVFLTGKKIVNMNLTNGPKIQQIEIEVLNQIKNRLNAVNAHQKTLEKGNNMRASCRRC